MNRPTDYDRAMSASKTNYPDTWQEWTKAVEKTGLKKYKALEQALKDWIAKQGVTK